MFDTLRARLAEGIGREVLDTVQQACEAQGGTYRVQHAFPTDDGFVRTMWDSKRLQAVQWGDVVHGGFAIAHERSGETWG